MYITVDELNTIMPSIFLRNELSTIKWGEITPDDKNALISRSGAFLDSLKYKGTYKEPYQINKFPRIMPGGLIVEVNDRVKKAQVCVVYEMLSNQVDSRYQLQTSGVTSMNLGGVSESYEITKLEEIKSRHYKKYLEPYLFKGVL